MLYIRVIMKKSTPFTSMITISIAHLPSVYQIVLATYVYAGVPGVPTGCNKLNTVKTLSERLPWLDDSSEYACWSWLRWSRSKYSIIEFIPPRSAARRELWPPVTFLRGNNGNWCFVIKGKIVHRFLFGIGAALIWANCSLRGPCREISNEECIYKFS